MPTSIVDRKTTVLKPRFGPDKMRLLGERLKGRLFSKFFFLKAQPEEVRLVSVDKYYEPFIVVGGKYTVDYCKQHSHTIQVEGNARKVAFFGEEFKPVRGYSAREPKTVKLDGETYFRHENKEYFVLDKMRREVAPEELPYAPCEEHPEEKLAEARMKLTEIRITLEEMMKFLQSKIAKRPPDVQVIKEKFELTEREIIYSPRYQLTFRHVKTGKEAIAKVDGVTGEVTVGRLEGTISNNFIQDFIDIHRQNLGSAEEEQHASGEGEAKLPIPPPLKKSNDPAKVAKTPEKEVISSKHMSKIEGRTEFPAKVETQVYHVGDNVTAMVGDVEIPSGTTIYETLVVKGHLRIGDDCRILGKVKALGDVIIGANTKIEKNVISGRNVIVGPNSVIRGSVESVGDIESKEYAVIEGGVRSKSTVELNQYTRVYGTLNAAKGVSVVKGSADE
ncbi:MAG: hypothetical protein JSV05_03385 [Candidatus Bathyarchaeota archaeon]|nr:MAG: hypothetical protein JSV05_03385 [Candidatus Bathyarchaeota archaeon]